MIATLIAQENWQNQIPCSTESLHGTCSIKVAQTANLHARTHFHLLRIALTSEAVFMQACRCDGGHITACRPDASQLSKCMASLCPDDGRGSTARPRRSRRLCRYHGAAVRLQDNSGEAAPQQKQPDQMVWSSCRSTHSGRSLFKRDVRPRRACA